jgi:CheY-like chemotaxis protein
VSSGQLGISSTDVSRDCDGNPGDPSRLVLVVEDHDDSRRLMERLLQSLGYDPILAHDGRSGLEAASARQPAVALIDLGLPGGMDGFGVARELRAKWGRSIRLIALTGYGEAEFGEQSRAAGFEHHLTKPVHPDHLIRLLTEFIGPPTDFSAGGPQ